MSHIKFLNKHFKSIAFSLWISSFWHRLVNTYVDSIVVNLIDWFLQNLSPITHKCRFFECICPSNNPADLQLMFLAPNPRCLDIHSQSILIFRPKCTCKPGSNMIHVTWLIFADYSNWHVSKTPALGCAFIWHICLKFSTSARTFATTPSNNLYASNKIDSNGMFNLDWLLPSKHYASLAELTFLCSMLEDTPLQPTKMFLFTNLESLTSNASWNTNHLKNSITCLVFLCNISVSLKLPG